MVHDNSAAAQRPPWGKYVICCSRFYQNCDLFLFKKIAKCDKCGPNFRELRHLDLLGLREFPIHGQHHQSVVAW